MTQFTPGAYSSSPSQVSWYRSTQSPVIYNRYITERATLRPVTRVLGLPHNGDCERSRRSFFWRSAHRGETGQNDKKLARYAGFRSCVHAFAQTVEKYGFGQRVLCLAFVQTNVHAPAQLGILQPIERKQGALYSSKFTERAYEAAGTDDRRAERLFFSTDFAGALVAKEPNYMSKKPRVMISGRFTKRALNRF